MLASVDEQVAGSLWAALETFGWIPGARVDRLADVTLVRSGTHYASFNNVLASRFDDAAAPARIPEILAAFAPDSLPVTWWVTATTAPADLAARLVARGFVRQEPEFAMAIDLRDGVRKAPLPPRAVLEAVERPDQLDGWLGVMHAAYGWPDARKEEIVRSMYRAGLDRPSTEADIRHFIVVDRGRVAACSSLFTAGGAAFVTNIGTVPEARGLGLGTAATVATLELARSLGRDTATLTASVDGRGLYRRLGFVEAGVIERYVADALVVHDR